MRLWESCSAGILPAVTLASRRRIEGGVAGKMPALQPPGRWRYKERSSERKIPDAIVLFTGFEKRNKE